MIVGAKPDNQAFSKPCEAEELVSIIRINGGVLIRPKLVSEAGAQVVPLSHREVEVLSYVAEGNSNRQIAHALNISEQTIKNHIASILRKLHANDRTHAVVLALRYGWTSI